MIKPDYFAEYTKDENWYPIICTVFVFIKVLQRGDQAHEFK